jgi:hypothetical protein
MKNKKPTHVSSSLRLPVHLHRELRKEAGEVKRSLHNLLLIVIEKHVAERRKQTADPPVTIIGEIMPKAKREEI